MRARLVIKYPKGKWAALYLGIAASHQVGHSQ